MSSGSIATKILIAAGNTCIAYALNARTSCASSVALPPRSTVPSISRTSKSTAALAATAGNCTGANRTGEGVVRSPPRSLTLQPANVEYARLSSRAKDAIANPLRRYCATNSARRDPVPTHSYRSSLLKGCRKVRLRPNLNAKLDRLMNKKDLTTLQ
jgi:hypothetical protein